MELSKSGTTALGRTCFSMYTKPEYVSFLFFWGVVREKEALLKYFKTCDD